MAAVIDLGNRERMLTTANVGLAGERLTGLLEHLGRTEHGRSDAPLDENRSPDRLLHQRGVERHERSSVLVDDMAVIIGLAHFYGIDTGVELGGANKMDRRLSGDIRRAGNDHAQVTLGENRTGDSPLDRDGIQRRRALAARTENRDGGYAEGEADATSAS